MLAWGLSGSRVPLRMAAERQQASRNGGEGER